MLGAGRRPGDGPLAPGEHEVELRGVRIWYLVRGSGPVLLIQPGGAGWGGDATVYVETLRPLEAAYTVVYYDPRGIGRSGRSDPTLYTLDEYVEDLEALRRHLGLDALKLAGHSHGGSVALKYALAYPERVDRLLVLNSGPFVRDPDPDWLAERAGFEAAQARWAAMDTTLPPDELHAEFIRTFVPVVHFYDYEPLRQTVEELLARTTFSAEPFQQSERELATFDIRDRVAEIRAPTLIVIGDHDPPDYGRAPISCTSGSRVRSSSSLPAVATGPCDRVPGGVLPGGPALSGTALAFRPSDAGCEWSAA
jgi:proline iminopeptidase